MSGNKEGRLRSVAEFHPSARFKFRASAAGHGARKRRRSSATATITTSVSAFDAQPVETGPARITEYSHHERDANAANNSYTENRIGISPDIEPLNYVVEKFYSPSGKTVPTESRRALLFNSSGHNRAMAYLRYGPRQGEGFIVITGIDTGKTMLVSNLSTNCMTTMSWRLSSFPHPDQ